ncbi:MAG: hypothetical protein Kow0010_22400 [Dehalococcoidia bacterium]
MAVGITFAGSQAASALRTASIADFTLPAVSYSHNDQTSTGELTLTVSDDGVDGWNVTVQASSFVYSGPNGGTDIPAANFSITAANEPTVVSGQAVDPTGGPQVPASGATGALDVPRKVLHADAGYGQGTYEQRLDVSLTIPGMARAGTYTSTLTVTISAGP